MSAEQMGWEMDQFSRHFDIKNYKNAIKISKALGIKPRFRLFEDVQENLETLEHFEDDLNLNISNLRLVKNFARTGKAIVANL